jgi:PKD domain/Bacterial Ig-like domain (group 3)
LEEAIMRSNESLRPLVARRYILRMASALSLGAAGLGVAGVAGLAALAAPPAGASTASASSPTTLAGTQQLNSTSVDASGIGVTATFDLSETLSWSQPAQVATTYDPKQIRQGRSPVARDSYARTGAGTLTVSWTLDDLAVTFGNFGTINVGSPSFSASGPCNLATDGAPFDCAVESAATALLATPDGYRGPYVNLGLKADVTVTPQQLATMRTLSDAGTAGSPVRLQIGETPVTDVLNLPCGDTAGGDLGYDLGTVSATDSVSVLNTLALVAGAAAPGATPGVEAVVPDASTTVPLTPIAGSIAMSGPGAHVDLGSLLADNLPPRVSAGGPYSGTEGIPIAFDGSGSKDACGLPSLVWNFSDGGVAYGANPEHTFAAPGLYGVRLTATDAAGLTSSTNFTVPVAELKPVVTAGGDQTTEWGLPVAFTGTATEAGATAQTFLDGWTFGDGAGASGDTVTHEYATPNHYTATFTSCDPSGHCGATAAQVTVTKRGTTSAYTGATASAVGGSVTYAASVLDDLGDPVPGGVVDFYADGSATPFASAVTNSMGFAFATSTFPSGAAGSHTVTVRYAGDSRYTGSSYGPVPYTVTASGVSAPGSTARTTGPAQADGAKLGTTLAYTGATASHLTGRVVYAASVLDDQGDPVPSAVVDFYADGSSAPFAHAVTNSMGFAFARSAFPRGTVGSHTVSARFAGDAHDTGSSYGPVPFLLYNAAPTHATVAQRGTTIAYTGATASAVTGRVVYAASVLDDLGDPVAGAVVDFYADGSATPFARAVTNSMGFAFATSPSPRGAAGRHTVTARYAGDARYAGSSYGPVPFAVTADSSA